MNPNFLQHRDAPRKFAFTISLESLSIFSCVSMITQEGRSVFNLCRRLRAKSHDGRRARSADAA
jgi:hypothetical protein